MGKSKVLLMGISTRVENWVSAMREAGIDPQVIRSPDSEHLILAMLREIEPDLVFIDVSDARLDGAAVVEQIRSDAERHRLPIILYSAHADEHERTAGLDAGADDFLAGQISVREMIARIRAVLRRA